MGHSKGIHLPLCRLHRYSHAVGLVALQMFRNSRGALRHDLRKCADGVQILGIEQSHVGVNNGVLVSNGNVCVMHKSPLSLSAQRFEAAQVEIVQFIGVIGSDRRWPFARIEACGNSTHCFAVLEVAQAGVPLPEQ